MIIDILNNVIGRKSTISPTRRYWNEAEVGKAVKASGIPREEIWLTSKVRSVVRDDRRRFHAIT